MILIKQDGIIHSAMLDSGEHVSSVIVRDYDASEYDTEKGIDSLGVDIYGKVYRKCGCPIISSSERRLIDISMKEYLYSRIRAMLGREDENVSLEGNVAEIPFATLFALLTSQKENA